MSKWKNMLALALLLLAAGGVSAQSAITFAGGNAVGNNGNMSYTAGEVAVKHAEGQSLTVVNITRYFTEGVQQSFLTNEVGIDSPISIQMNVYPNPTTGVVVVESDNEERQLAYTLYDNQGRQLMAGTHNGGRQQLDLTPLATGTYMLRVSDSQHGESNIYRIIKTN